MVYVLAFLNETRDPTERKRLKTAMESYVSSRGLPPLNFIADGIQEAIGHLEKLLSLAIADSPGVNVNESERERSGIIRRQFCGVRRVEAIFRGAPLLMSSSLGTFCYCPTYCPSAV